MSSGPVVPTVRSYRHVMGNHDLASIHPDVIAGIDRDWIESDMVNWRETHVTHYQYRMGTEA